MTGFTNEPRRGESNPANGTGMGVPAPAQYTSPAGPPGTAKRGTSLAVIISVDNATSPRYCTIAVNNKSPFEAGYLLPTGVGPFAAGGTAGYNYFYDNSSGIGGSIVNVDLDARMVLNFTGDSSSTAPTPFYKAITDHLHSGNLNPDGYTNPNPVDLSTGQTVNTLPYNQNSPGIQGVISSNGNVIATDFPGQVTQIVSGTYSGYYQDNVSLLFDSHFFSMSPGDWLYMDWTALNVNGGGTSNQGWGPIIKDAAGNRILFNNFNNQVALTKYTGGTWTAITSFSNPAPGTNDANLHKYTMGVQYVGGTTFRYQLIIDGTKIADYLDTTSVLTSANLTPGFYQDATNNVYIRSYDYYTQNFQALTAPSTTSIALSGVNLSNYIVGATTYTANLAAVLTFTNAATISNWLQYIDVTYTSDASAGQYGSGGLLAVRIPASSIVINGNQISLNTTVALPTGSAWYLHIWVADNTGKCYPGTPNPPIQAPLQTFSSKALPAMPAGATIGAANMTASMFDGGLRTTMGGGGAYIAPELRVTFMLQDSNNPPASTWGYEWIGYTRLTTTNSPVDKTTYRRVNLGSSNSLANGAIQTVYYGGLTPGTNIDIGIALSDNQGNETPMIQLISNEPIPQVSNGTPIGPIIGPGHLYGQTPGTSITTPISLKHIPDDSGSGRYAVAQVDTNRRALVDFSQSGHTGQFQTSAWFLSQQSMVPVVSDYSITCTGTFPSSGSKLISYSWPGWTWETADGTTTTYASGFSSSTTTDYQGNAIVSGSYKVTAAYNWGTIGNVTTWFTSGPINLSYGIQFMGNGKMTLVVNQGPITVPSTSGTSGSAYTPPAPQCPSAKQVIQTLERGYVPAGTIKPGEHVRGFNRWVKVKNNSIGRSEILRVIIDNRSYDVEKTHLWLTEIGWWPAEWLERGDRLVNFNYKKPWIRVQRIYPLGVGDYAKLEVEGHLLRFGSDDPAVGHNVNYQTQ